MNYYLTQAGRRLLNTTYSQERQNSVDEVFPAILAGAAKLGLGTLARGAVGGAARLGLGTAARGAAGTAARGAAGGAGTGAMTGAARTAGGAAPKPGISTSTDVTKRVVKNVGPKPPKQPGKPSPRQSPFKTARQAAQTDQGDPYVDNNQEEVTEDFKRNPQTKRLVAVIRKMFEPKAKRDARFTDREKAVDARIRATPEDRANRAKGAAQAQVVIDRIKKG